MTLIYPHDHEERHKGNVPDDQLGSGTATPGFLLTPDGAGFAEWAPFTLDTSALSRLIAYMSTDMTGIGSGSFVEVEFDSTTGVVGTDIEVDGGDNTLVNILTDGIYAVTGGWFSTLDTPADGTAAYVQLSGVSIIGPYIEGQPDAAYGIFAANPGYTTFLAAGSSLQLSGSMEGSDWTLGAFSGVLVQRII